MENSTFPPYVLAGMVRSPPLARSNFAFNEKVPPDPILEVLIVVVPVPSRVPDRLNVPVVDNIKFVPLYVSDFELSMVNFPSITATWSSVAVPLIQRFERL